jgi:hypothetical protein
VIIAGSAKDCQPPRLIDKTDCPGCLECFLGAPTVGNRSRDQKKELQAERETDQILADLLWDFPPEARRISEQSRPVLQRRLQRLSLPRRRVVAASWLAQTCSLQDVDATEGETTADDLVETPV